MYATGSSCSVTDEQMQCLQQKAQDMILQLKEEEKWHLYCRKKGLKILDGDDQMCEKYPASHPETRTSYSIPEMQKTENTIVAKELKFIRSKLSHLQSSLTELKARKDPYKNSWDSYYENLFTNNKYNQSINRIAFLRKNLENTLSLVNADRRSGNSCENPTSNETIKPKCVAFQMPYILKEQRAVENRSSCKSWTSTPPKKNVSKSPSRQIFQPQIFPRSLKEPSISNRIKAPSSLNRNSVQDNTVNRVADEMLEDILQETFPVMQSVQKLKAKYVNDNLTSLVKQIEEIEKIETDVHEKWHRQQPHNPYRKVQLLSEQDEVGSSCQLNGSRDEMKNENAEVPLSGIPRENVPLNGNQEDIKDDRQTSTELNNMSAISTTTLCLSTNSLKRIHEYRRNFQLFVSKRYTGISKEIMDQAVEAIYDDCLEDIAMELNNISRSIVLDLYNREFIT